MSDTLSSITAFVDALNVVKRTAHPASALKADHYLGGDLGIDSIEMLEIWFRTEKVLGIKLADDAKRDIYTVGEVLAVLDRHAGAGAAGDV